MSTLHTNFARLFLFVLAAISAFFCSLSAQETTEEPSSALQEIPSAESMLAAPALTTSAARPMPTYAVSFNNISIIEYIRGFVAKVANKNFIFNEEELQFNLTLISPEGTSINNIMASLTQVLRIRGFALVEQGNNLIIYKGTEPPRSSQVLSDEDSSNHNLPDAIIITRIFRLQTFPVDKIEPLLKSLISPNAIVAMSPETRQFVVTDFNSNIRKVQDLVKTVDQNDNTGMEIAYYKVRNSPIPSLVQLVLKIVTPLSPSKPPVIEVDGKTNTLFIVAQKPLLDRTLRILESLDVPDQIPLSSHAYRGSGSTEEQDKFISQDASGSGFFIYKLQYHQGDKIKDSLSGMATTLIEAGIATRELVSAINTAQWIPNTNSIMFAGSQESLSKIRGLLKEIDVAQKQVFLEILVIQTTLDNSLEFGVDWGLSGNSIHNRIQGGLGTTNQGLVSTIAGSGVANTPKSFINTSQQFQLGVIGDVIKRKGVPYLTLGAVINAIKEDKNSSILINPKIIAQDNVKAEIKFISSKKIVVGSTKIDPTNATNSIKIEEEVDFELGNKLIITPILNQEDLITLDLDLDFSQDGNDGKGSKRSTTTKTRVHIPDNQFLVLCGQIYDSKDYTKKQVPCLGGVPGIGLLFSNTEKNHNKNNIMIFMRPHIIRNAEEAEALTKGQKRILHKNSVGPKLPDTLDATLKFLNLQIDKSKEATPARAA